LFCYIVVDWFQTLGMGEFIDREVFDKELSWDGLREIDPDNRNHMRRLKECMSGAPSFLYMCTLKGALRRLRGT